MLSSPVISSYGYIYLVDIFRPGTDAFQVYSFLHHQTEGTFVFQRELPGRMDFCRSLVAECYNMVPALGPRLYISGTAKETQSLDFSLN